MECGQGTNLDKVSSPDKISPGSACNAPDLIGIDPVSGLAQYQLFLLAYIQESVKKIGRELNVVVGHDEPIDPIKRNALEGGVDIVELSPSAQRRAKKRNIVTRLGEGCEDAIERRASGRHFNCGNQHFLDGQLCRASVEVSILGVGAQAEVVDWVGEAAKSAQPPECR